MKRLIWGLLLGLIIQCSVYAQNNINISLLATADIHGVAVPWDYTIDAQNLSGSLSQLSTKIKEIRANTPNIILVDAGDTIQGNFIETFKDEQISPMMLGLNAVDFDVWVLGNHEFDFGRDVLARSVEQFKGVTLTANLTKDDGSLYVPAYKIFEIEGVKVAIIGATTTMTAQFAKGTDRINGLNFENPTEVIKPIIRELKNKKVDAIILVSHMGIDNENDVPHTGNRDIVTENPEIDVVVAGHMHVKIEQDKIGNTIVTEPYAYGRALSRIDLTFSPEKQGFKLIDKKSYLYDMKGVESDKDIEKIFELYHTILRENANKPIAEMTGVNPVLKTEVKGVPQIYVQDSGVIALYQEASMHYMPEANVISMLISLDDPRLELGSIKVKDIAYNFTYKGGEVTVYQVTGKELKAYMEWIADYYAQQKDGDVTIGFNPARRAWKYSTNDVFANVTYLIDLTEPTGKRIKNLAFADGAPITDETPINLGMNSYRMGHLTQKGGVLEGQSFPIITNSKSKYGIDNGTMRNLAIRYLSEAKRGHYESKTVNRWSIKRATGYDRERKIVEKLLNDSKITVPVSDDGRYTNMGSINVKDKLFTSKDAYNKAIQLKEMQLKETKTEIEKKRLADDITIIKAINTF